MTGKAPTLPRPLSVTVAISLLGFVALIPLLQLVVGSGRLSLYALLPVVVGLGVNGGLAILLLRPRRWAVIVTALRGLAGILLSWVNLSTLRARWGEWDFHGEGRVMMWLVVGAIASAGIVIAALLPATLRWTDPLAAETD